MLMNFVYNKLLGKCHLLLRIKMKYCMECGTKFNEQILVGTCSNCNKEYNNPIPVVLVLVFNDNNQVLLTRKDNYPNGFTGDWFQDL